MPAEHKQGTAWLPFMYEWGRAGEDGPPRERGDLWPQGQVLSGDSMASQPSVIAAWNKY